MKQLIFALTALFFSSAAFAEDAIPPSPIAKTALIVDAEQVKAGVPILAGVTFTMPDHWHIYWQNPGDSGIPTRLNWTLPESISASDIHWPAPERLETSGLVNYGYSNTITLPVMLTPARDGVAGDVTVNAKWLICREVCIPESATLTAPLAANPAAAATLNAALAREPKPLSGSGTAHYKVEATNVVVSVSVADAGSITAAHFYPIDDGVIANNAAQQLTLNADGTWLALTTPRGQSDLLPELHGVLTLTRASGSESFAVTAAQDGALPAAAQIEPAASAPAPAAVPVSFLAAALLALVGGLILNVMPCVLPILALKALAIAKKAQASRAAAAKQGVAYTIGVVASFLLIAGVMLALKASGSAIGWGFQLQNSGFVAMLTLIMLGVSANLLGLFELPVLFGSTATGVDDSSPRGSFLTGVLAVMVATPCTAPFMATAVGATLALPPAQSLVVFAMIGVGMALPFLLISIWPAALRLLPKPGAWMKRFKHLLAIPMLATAAWLIWVLVQLNSGPMKMDDMAHEAYSPARLEQLRTEGTPVLVDATAAWCLTCKINERVALKPEATQQLFREHKVVTLVADWTNSDPVITEYLASFGRNGVPLVVYYPPHAEPNVLPQILTPEIIRAAVVN